MVYTTHPTPGQNECKRENPICGIVLISGAESNHMNEKATIFDCPFNM